MACKLFKWFFFEKLASHVKFASSLFVTRVGNVWIWNLGGQNHKSKNLGGLWPLGPPGSTTYELPDIDSGQCVSSDDSSFKCLTSPIESIIIRVTDMKRGFEGTHKRFSTEDLMNSQSRYSMQTGQKCRLSHGSLEFIEMQLLTMCRPM